MIEITVKDNGNGIPQKDYDIIKAHGGEIKVETKEDEGAEFAIQLPLNNAS
jgi:signal transduction histidine kinase